MCKAIAIADCWLTSRFGGSRVFRVILVVNTLILDQTRRQLEPAAGAMASTASVGQTHLTQ
jgi:hypothetical protein